MGGSSGSQQTQSSSKTSPWAPTQPLLQNILGSITSGYDPSVKPVQQQALQQIQNNAGSLPNLSPQVAGLSNQLLGGIPDLNSMMSNAYNTSSNALSPQLQSNFLDPMNNPYTKGALNTTNQDITNQIMSMFAGAGQTPGPAEAQALARGLGQGESGILMNQFNTNAGLQQGAAGENVGIAGAANQGLLGNANAGIQNLPNIASAANLGPLSSLQASQMAYNLPLSQIGGVEGLTLPIAGLGGQTQSNSNTQYQQQASPLQMAQQAGGAFNSFLNPFGGQFSPISGFGSFMKQLG